MILLNRLQGHPKEHNWAKWEEVLLTADKHGTKLSKQVFLDILHWVIAYHVTSL